MMTNEIEPNWNVTLKVSLHRDKNSTFRNTRLAPTLCGLGLSRTCGGTFEGTANSKETVARLKKILQELVDPAERGSGPRVKRASLKSLELKIREEKQVPKP